MLDFLFGLFKRITQVEQVDSSNNVTKGFPLFEPSHPYYPRNLVLPDYVAPTLSMPYILSIFFIAFFTVILASSLILFVGSQSKKLNRLDKLAFLWFVVCGCIHTFFEGYFATFHETMQGDNALLGQLWKEYALSDSRYLSSDPFVVNMERITAAIWGPLSFATAFAIYQQWPSRYVLQLLDAANQCR
ncbi:hypothetical protein G9A89_008701 [Geosiphon pyriformis]|nr:hypothetical protein G9A89_008701 [Geosiphon pyriformis]